MHNLIMLIYLIEDGHYLFSYLNMFMENQEIEVKEYVSQLNAKHAKEGLKNIAPILALITERLKQRDSYYFDLFKILLELSEENVDAEALHQQVSNEDEDYTPEALDAVWEEEQIRFLGEEGCNSALQHQHKRRFVNNVSPQYLNISDINGVQQ